MNLIFSFFRGGESDSLSPGEEAASGDPAVASDAMSGSEMEAAPGNPTSIPLEIGQDMTRVLNRMLDELRKFLTPEDDLPDPEVILIRMNEKSVGLGNFLGEQSLGPLGRVELKGGRLDGVVRFMLWGTSLPAVNDAILDLQAELLAAAQMLYSRGFLHFNALTSSDPVFDSTLGTWGRTADYSLLYEYHYRATDAAESLIARIPIHADQEVFNSADREDTLVTDEMARWDELTAPILAVRGRGTFSHLSALAFFTSTFPTGIVTITRTHDGAAGPLQDYPALADFLTALNDPISPERHGRVVFASLADFMAQFTPSGTTLLLGDWNLDDNLDEYQGFDLGFEPPIQLPKSSDRLEVIYGNADESFDQAAVMYLKLGN